MNESSDFEPTGPMGPSPRGAKSRKDSRQISRELTTASEDLNVTLPQEFKVTYLGKREAVGLWGIRYTRKPVEAMVATAKELEAGLSDLPYLRLTVTEDGIYVTPLPENCCRDAQKGLYPIQAISYGVQDVIYTRVFAMIVVRETADITKSYPFLCHGFLCESRHATRHLTFALATAFKIFSTSVKAQELKKKPKRFAIDLRTPEEIHADGSAVDDGSEA